MISLIVPTIAGREHWLQKCLDSYKRTTPGLLQVIIVRDRPTCGVAWQEGADQAHGEYLHFTADDIEAHEGWAEAAIGVVDAGKVPCARVLNDDGTLQSCGEWGQEMPDGAVTDIARVPFLSREQWAAVVPMLRTHWYTDNYVSFRCAQAGFPTVVCRDMVFTHHFAQEGRIHPDVTLRERDEYERACFGH